MKNNRFLVLLVVMVMAISQAFSQDIPDDINNISDTQLQEYWQKAQAKGYTMAQLKAAALAKGVSPADVATLESRINALPEQSGNSAVSQAQNNLTIDEDTQASNQLSSLEVKEGVKEDLLFGYSFFNNQNISFAPNVNLATPETYQLGPGDELVISVWGAAETNYDQEVNREGAIHIPSIGPIYVSGMTIANAKKKINSRLQHIYSGINAPSSSPYKVYTNISLTNVRTVQVNIIGEVKVPGTYSLSALSTVLNALYACGGPTKEGTFRNIMLVRGDEIITFDIYDYLVNGSQEGNVTLQDQDLIMVKPYISRVSVNGAVKRPGKYEMMQGETFTDLLDFTSGFTANAYTKVINVSRLENNERRIIEINKNDIENTTIKDGDSITISSYVDDIENKVEIEGAIKKDGDYEFVKGMTVKDLIDKAEGIEDYAFMDRGLITRTQDKIRKEIVPFSLADVLSEKANITLQKYDVVKVFNKYDLQEDYTLSISGAVNEPGSFPYYENVTIRDLVALASGFKDGADPNLIDVYRKIDDDNYETLTETIRLTETGELAPENADFILQPDDRVSVRHKRGYGEQVSVSIEGEVDRPGKYWLENKTERISDLFEKCGGLSPYAFIDGVTLIRKNINRKTKDTEEEVIQTEIVEGGVKDVEGFEDLNNQDEYAVGIDIESILNNPSSKSNLALKEGDRIVVPSVTETVKVEGEVFLPSLVRFEKGMGLKQYINKSGGFSPEAKKSKVYVVHANGDIDATSRFLFFKFYPKVKPGSLVLVPQKVPNENRMTVQEATALSTGLATLAFVIFNITK